MKKNNLILEILVLAAVLALAAWLRFANLRSLPGWFLDEGEFVSLAGSLAKGSFDFLGLRGSTLLIGRLPLFMWLAAGAFRLFGTDIVVLRAFTALCGVLTVGAAYGVARQAFGRGAAFTSALLLAIVPEVVFYNRAGFTYNWVALLLLVFVYTLWQYLEHESGQGRWLAAASLAAGAALASDFLGLVPVAVLALVLLIRRPADLWKAALLASLPVVCAALPIFLNAPRQAWYDLALSFRQGSVAGESQSIALVRMIRSYAEMLQKQLWVTLGLAGLLTLPNPRLRNLLFAVLGCIFVLDSHSRVLEGQYLIPVWPLALLCVGSLVQRGQRLAFETIKAACQQMDHFLGIALALPARQLLGSLVSVLTVFAFFFSPLIWLLGVDVRVFATHDLELDYLVFKPIFPRVYLPAEEADAVAAALRPNLQPGDFVIGPATVTWMLPAASADFRTVLIYEKGGAAMNIPDFDMARFTRPEGLADARYAIVDDTWRDWAAGAPQIQELLQVAEGWPLVMTQGSLDLHCNPTFCR